MPLNAPPLAILGCPEPPIIDAALTEQCRAQRIRCTQRDSVHHLYIKCMAIMRSGCCTPTGWELARPVRSPELQRGYTVSELLAGFCMAGAARLALPLPAVLPHACMRSPQQRRSLASLRPRQPRPCPSGWCGRQGVTRRDRWSATSATSSQSVADRVSRKQHPATPVSFHNTAPPCGPACRRGVMPLLFQMSFL